MIDMNELVKRVEEWGDAKGITDGPVKGTPERQVIKTLEEVVETMEAIYNKDTAEISDGIGDVVVTCILLSKLTDSDIRKDLLGALEVIEKRTGRMINGTFVKEN